MHLYFHCRLKLTRFLPWIPPLLFNQSPQNQQTKEFLQHQSTRYVIKQLRCSNVINNGDYNIFPGTYQCSLYQFTVKCFLLDFAECKKWKSLGVFSKSLHTFRSEDCLFNHVVPIQYMNSHLKSWNFKIDSDC